MVKGFTCFYICVAGERGRYGLLPCRTQREPLADGILLASFAEMGTETGLLFLGTEGVGSV